MPELPKQEATYRRPGKRSGADQDVFTKWRDLLCYTHRPGVCKGVKRSFNQRSRAQAKRTIREELESLRA